MSLDDSTLRSLADFAVDIARGAGELTLRHFRGSFEIDRKADGSPVTIADREAEGLPARSYREELSQRRDHRRGSRRARRIVGPMLDHRSDRRHLLVRARRAALRRDGRAGGRRRSDGRRGKSARDRRDGLRGARARMLPQRPARAGIHASVAEQGADRGD